MARRVEVDITQELIDRAIRAHSAQCVVAVGIARKLPDATRIDVDLRSIRFTRKEIRYVFLTPPSIQQYIVDFDAGDKIFPFRFRLQRPHEYKTVKRPSTPTKQLMKQPAEKEQAKAQSKLSEGPPLTNRTPPRGFKRKVRSYGHRFLRINQERGK